VYALAKTKDGELYIEYMSASQIASVQEASKAKKGPWSGPFATEMWRKSVTRRLAKRLPMSTDAQKTIDLDDDMYTVHQEKDVTPAKPKEKITRLNSLLDAAQVSETPPPQAQPEPQTSEPEEEIVTPVDDEAVKLESPL